MKSTTMICKQCKGPMEYEEGSEVARCPYCGYIEKMTESDYVKRERIRARAYKEIELGKKKIEKDATIKTKKLRLEEKELDFRKAKYVIFVLVLVALASLIAFKVYHRGKIHIGQAHDYYEGRNYTLVSRLLSEAGFEIINEEPIAILSKNEEKAVGEVTMVSIGGDPHFGIGWYLKDAPVTIRYMTLNPERMSDVQIPIGNDDFSEMDYLAVWNEFQKAGFTNMVLVPKQDVNFYEGSKSGTVQSVTVKGSTFQKGLWLPKDTEVKITYRTKPLKYIGEDFSEVKETISRMGFNDIELMPLNDLVIKEQKEIGKVSSVLIGDKELSEAENWNLQSHIVIKYHSEQQANSNQVKISVASKDLKGMDYQEAISLLKGMGFTNVTTISLGDLTKGWLYGEGEVKEVTIDGLTKFLQNEIFDQDVEVVVSYHSFPDW